MNTLLGHWIDSIYKLAVVWKALCTVCSIVVVAEVDWGGSGADLAGYQMTGSGGCHIVICQTYTYLFDVTVVNWLWLLPDWQLNLHLFREIQIILEAACLTRLLSLFALRLLKLLTLVKTINKMYMSLTYI